MRSKVRPVQFGLAILVALALLPACSKNAPERAAVTSPGVAAAPASAAASPSGSAPVLPEKIVGSMAVRPDHASIGEPVTVTGQGLPADSTLQLRWGTVRGSYDIQGELHELYLGRVFTPIYRTIGSITTDASGSFRDTFRLPDDYGFLHDLLLVRDGVVVNKTAVSVDMQVRVSPRSGPVGTPITISVEGLGWDKMENVWQVLYDNRGTGFLSATTTGGNAVATIPAVGRPGIHTIDVVEGPFTFAYRNIAQSPFPYLTPFSFDFRVTKGRPVLPPPAAEQGLAVVPGTEPSGSGPAIWVDPAAGPVGTPIVIHGRGLPAARHVELNWDTMVGNRVSGKGWELSHRPLPVALTDPQGGFAVRIRALDDLGGAHPITALIGGEDVASTSFTVQPTVLGLEPSRVAAGQPFTMHLKGVGWTETSNIFTVVYDNAFVGYVCGFNSQGTVNVDLRASGERGWHFVDLYPAIYKGEEPLGVDTYRIPQLTFHDHPGENLPAFHLALYVTS